MGEVGEVMVMTMAVVVLIRYHEERCSDIQLHLGARDEDVEPMAAAGNV
jgi:hypothetical protein